MKVKIEEALKSVYPDIRLGCLWYEADVEEENEDLWNYMHEQVLPEITKQIEVEGLTNMEGIRSSRAAYKAFGRNPGRYRVSSESLLRRVRQGHELYHVNSIVDVNNLVSVQTACSLGSYDLKHIQGDICLSVGKVNEGYEGIGKDFIDMENMLLLKDDLGPFGSPTSDSHRAMIGLDSKQMVTILYCFSSEIDLEAEMEKAKDYFIQYAHVQNAQIEIVK